MTIRVHSHLVFIVDRADRDDLFAYADKLMNALLNQETCNSAFTDSAVSADAARGVIEIEADASGREPSHAIASLQAAVRASLHEVGIGTPDWPTHDEVMSMVLKDLRTEQLA